MNKKTIAISAFIVVIIIGGICLFKYSQDVKKLEKPATEYVVKPTTISSSEENKTDNYKIILGYPQFTGIKNQDAQTKINADIKKHIFDIISDDRKSSKENCNFSNLGKDAPDWQCEYDITFDSFDTVADKLLSIKMEYYQFTGGAHGGTQFEYLNYNLETGEKINWQDVFKKDSNYLQVISDYSKIQLKKQLLQGQESMSDEKWITEGTKPNPDNYNTNVGFYSESSKAAENRGLSVTFQQYQVAAYAQGPVEIVVPYTELRDVIDANGLLGKLVK
jgi:hypothetical protein